MSGIRLSERLGTIASMVSPCDTFTDVGCDHALLPIWLLSQGICKKAVATDINSGPLSRAKANADSFALGEDKISFILSDGLRLVKDPPEGKNTLSICGMGGLLIEGIIKDSADKIRKYDTLILSPHTKQYELRLFLNKNGYCIEDEKFVCEDGKLYVIIKAVPVKAGEIMQDLSEKEYRFGRFIKEALKDTKVREKLTAELKAAERLLRDNKQLPEDRRQLLMQDLASYREVLEN